MVIFSRIPKKIVILGWVSFLADISSEMIYPLIPIFLTRILGAPTFSLGLVEGVANITVSFVSALSGFASDRIRNRLIFVRIGYGLPFFGKGLIALASSWHGVLIGRAVDRLGKGLRGSPRDAMIADAVSPERRGEAFGYHRMMDTAGAFVGVLIAGLAMWLLKDQSLEGVCRVVFLFAAFIAALSWGTTFLLEREHQSKDTQGRDTASSSSTLSGPRPISVLSKESFFNLSRFGKKYWQVVGVLILFALANSSDTFLLLKASDIGLSPVAIVMIYALYNISYSLFSFPAGKLSDRFGRWTLIASGWLVYAAVYALISVSDSASIWGIFRGYGLYMALTEGVSKALIIDSVPSDLKGAALGILYLLLGLTSFSSNIIAGYAWDNISKDSPFLIGSTFALIATFFALMLGRKERI